jgi:hypothetical protein
MLQPLDCVRLISQMGVDQSEPLRRDARIRILVFIGTNQAQRLLALSEARPYPGFGHVGGGSALLQRQLDEKARLGLSDCVTGPYFNAYARADDTLENTLFFIPIVARSRVQKRGRNNTGVDGGWLVLRNAEGLISGV